ncbi:STAS-like domain-containing protein [Phaeobacter gallaeciensis]|uniref:STAS-like domain-containing protein n=1 Tax=Phaeobacter gallaeciensis TaxID=60890 RepID=UPI00237FC0B4|nr:STAS-like domain-containing protein [Phaeobacter gallaeciensis]MDE4305617.1 STAS-like domain-containing protein [Phaeobacter gallaeciensis]MDE4309965.1 STAS-like domain-containing protein [Phaeobacter gallaeciensis]MDE4314422.1 STAS-like domain-containing protein [Phaeobacter gallaeciensis]MDE4318735.1 STAS-like domain-containing protein [Phaeobacter gallaeciensis]MDE4322897.1 STAS-like domain-containing protein [Phaeobacter gallaeciensis]
MVVVVKSVVGACDTNAHGAVLRDLILDGLDRQQPMCLDFTGIFNATSSFVNTAFLEVVEQRGFDAFKANVSLKNVNKQIAGLVRSRLSSFVSSDRRAA